MRTILLWVFIFVFGFVVGAGVGFKVLEGVSNELLVEAWDNSYQQFQKSYPGSTTQQVLNQKVEEQKAILVKNLEAGFREQLLNMFSFGGSKEKTETSR